MIKQIRNYITELKKDIITKKRTKSIIKNLSNNILTGIATEKDIEIIIFCAERYNLSDSLNKELEKVQEKIDEARELNKKFNENLDYDKK